MSQHAQERAHQHHNHEQHERHEHEHERHEHEHEHERHEHEHERHEHEHERHEHEHEHHEHHEVEDNLRRAVDYAGAGVGLICAVHCALTPLALSLAPIAGVGVLWREEGESVLMSSLAALAIVSALSAAWKSRHWGVTLGFIASLTLMYVSHELVEAEAQTSWLSLSLISSIVAGLGVMGCHLWSLKLQRERACCAAH